MTSPIVEVNGLTKILGDKDLGYKVLDDVSFKVQRGKILGISSSSGGGSKKHMIQTYTEARFIIKIFFMNMCLIVLEFTLF